MSFMRIIEFKICDHWFVETSIVQCGQLLYALKCTRCGNVILDISRKTQCKL